MTSEVDSNGPDVPLGNAVHDRLPHTAAHAGAVEKHNRHALSAVVMNRYFYAVLAWNKGSLWGAHGRSS